MAKRKKSQPKPTTGIGALGLLLAGTAVALIGYLLKDSLGFPLRFWGAFIWLMALGLAFMFGLLHVSQHILSLGGGEGWSQGLTLLLRYYLQEAKNYLKSLTAPKPTQRRRLLTDKPISDPDALAETFKTLKAGMVHSHQALAIDKKGGFHRAAGPGFIMLTGKESVRAVVDLRPHVRSQVVKANTRDGIPVETTVIVTFRARQNPGNATDPGIQYPYDRDAIFHLGYATSISPSEEARPWAEQVSPRAAELLSLELAKYTLDDLYRVPDAHVVPIADMQLRIMSDLAHKMEQHGIEVMHVAITDLALPRDISEQRIKNWRARWEREVDVRRAQGDAEALRRIKKARARVQIEIIESIIQNIEAMRRTETADLADIVMLRMIEVLEAAMSDVSVQRLAPEYITGDRVLDASRQLRAATAPPAPAQEKAGHDD